MEYIASKKKNGKKHIYNENTRHALCNVERGTKKSRTFTKTKDMSIETCGNCLRKIAEGRPYSKTDNRPPAPKNQKKNFYQTWEWKKVRYRVIKKYGAICMLCGATKDDEKITVDHIKPRTRYPDLALDEDNLQVLCNSCNMGKSNTDETDHRP